MLFFHVCIIFVRIQTCLSIAPRAKTTPKACVSNPVTSTSSLWTPYPSQRLFQSHFSLTLSQLLFQHDSLRWARVGSFCVIQFIWMLFLLSNHQSGAALTDCATLISVIFYHQNKNVWDIFLQYAGYLPDPPTAPDIRNCNTHNDVPTLHCALSFQSEWTQNFGTLVNQAHPQRDHYRISDISLCFSLCIPT